MLNVPSLLWIGAPENRLTKIDLRGSVALTSLGLDGNNIDYIDVSQFTELRSLWISQTEFPNNRDQFINRFNQEGSNVNSVYQYFWNASYQQLSIRSHFYPAATGNTILSYQSPNPRNHYLPHSSTNSIGYTTNQQRFDRQYALLSGAIVHVRNQIPTSL